jgi:hypothetical protein
LVGFGEIGIIGRTFQKSQVLWQCRWYTSLNALWNLAYRCDRGLAELSRLPNSRDAGPLGSHASDRE